MPLLQSDSTRFLILRKTSDVSHSKRKYKSQSWEGDTWFDRNMREARVALETDRLTGKIRKHNWHGWKAHTQKRFWQLEQILSKIVGFYFFFLQCNVIMRLARGDNRIENIFPLLSNHVLCSYIPGDTFSSAAGVENMFKMNSRLLPFCKALLSTWWQCHPQDHWKATALQGCAFRRVELSFLKGCKTKESNLVPCFFPPNGGDLLVFPRNQVIYTSIIDYTKVARRGVGSHEFILNKLHMVPFFQKEKHFHQL